MSSKPGWWDVFKVVQSTTRVTGGIIDAVFADDVEDALDKASKRNGLKPWEEFGVRRAKGSIGAGQSRSRHLRRSHQIDDLKELIEAHV